VAPRIKLRRDDVEFVCNQIQERGMDERHLKWLVSFIQSGIAPDAKHELLESLNKLAMADHLLHPAEAAVIRKARELLGESRCQADGQLPIRRAGTAQACPNPPSRRISVPCRAAYEA
jgi:uncharacterized tellurite resistance protein B-like protein